MPLAAALPYIAVGASAAGTGLSLAANAQEQSAINAARANEVNQQRALQNQANAIFQNSLAQSTPATAQQQLQQGAAARNSAFQDLQSAITPVASALPTANAGANANTPTAGAQQRATSAGDTWNSLLARANATEGSYGDWQNQQAIKNADTAQKLGVINNFSAGDASLLPTELQVASQAGDSLGGWGSILSSLGNLAGYAGKFATPAMPAVSPAAAQSMANWATDPNGLYNSIALGGLPNGSSTPGSFGLSGISPDGWRAITNAGKYLAPDPDY